MTTPPQALRAAISRFEGVTWSNHGEPAPGLTDGKAVSPAWVKFGIEKSELAWRTLEFLAWAFDDMVRARKRLFFWPVSNPPYHNTLGECLSFVVECYIDQIDEQRGVQQIADHLADWQAKYWPRCKP